MYKFWAIVLALIGVLFVDNRSYREVFWFFIWAPVTAVVLGYYTLKFFAWIEDK